MTDKELTYFLLAFCVALIAACCRLAQLLGRERAATGRLRWKLLGANLQIDAHRASKREEEWPETLCEK